MYNAITRAIEPELMPALRRLGMSFYAYNPLAGGVLTGKHSKGSASGSRTGGRFTDDTAWGKIYQSRFMQDAQFDAVEIVRAACKAADIPMAAAALRWMMHHSYLGEGDGVIIGASSLSHFESNMESCAQGPLPPIVVEAYDQAWKACSSVVPAFSRGYFGQEAFEAKQ